MPELLEQMFCSQQIVIPPKFPYILKRYCKAAIKTQPYDVLRWSYEYFKALSEHKTPPVKLRLEYPIYSTEGGLTRGCLKVLANQLLGMSELPLPVVKSAWRGFCLDPKELTRIFCLCGVYLRKDTVPFLHFLAVSASFLTKSLTHTMILLCESLTKEPDGGSAAISVYDFLEMYKLLARIDASKDFRYINGYREGDEPEPEIAEVEEETQVTDTDVIDDDRSDEYWGASENLHKVTLIDASVARSPRLSVRMNMPTLGKIERSPSAERAGQIEWDNYQRERKGRAEPSDEVNKKLRDMSTANMISKEDPKEDLSKAKEAKVVEKKKEGVEIFVYDENNVEVPYVFFGEPTVVPEEFGEEETDQIAEQTEDEHDDEVVVSEMDNIQLIVAEQYLARQIRLEDLEETIDSIAQIVNRFKSANYDLGMVAGRMMSTTSGEFVVQHIEKDIMAYIDEQIGILPDPDLKKKKAKPEEVAMVREILEKFLDENMDLIIPEIEEVEEEEQAIPEITLVYAVPGIGPKVDDDIICEFQDYALDVCKVQADVLMPRNIRHFLCPPLEKYIEYKYDENMKNDVTIGGVNTD